MQEFAWTIPSNHKIRSVDWFWAIAIMTLVGAVTAIAVGNTLFGVFILMAGGLLFYTNLNHGDDVTVKVNEKEVVVNDLKYAAKHMKGFDISKSSTEENILILRTDRFFMPMLILHIPESIPLDQLEAILLKRIQKEELREPPANALAERLGL